MKQNEVVLRMRQIKVVLRMRQIDTFTKWGTLGHKLGTSVKLDKV